MNTEMELFENKLSDLLFRSECPSVELLIDYAAQQVTGKQREAVAKHLIACPHCTVEMEEIELVAGVSNADGPKFWRRIGDAVLQLIIGEIQQPDLALQVRSAENSMLMENREVLFKEVGWVLLLTQLLDSGRTFRLEGDLLGPDAAAYTTIRPLLASLHNDQRYIGQIDIEEGTFEIIGIPSGSYTLHLLMQDSELILDIPLNFQ